MTGGPYVPVSRRRAAPPALLSPFGLLVLLVVRAVRKARSRPGQTHPDRLPDAALP
ncbi:hypothetical protein ACIQ6K_06900 [Streptomyces sp. NPDC096354]|uniref:hypothetical protein n=1 Tax=Streptomyces sp. NPDC096354 TaxID=3366088 RepID=UPI00382F9575